MKHKKIIQIIPWILPTLLLGQTTTVLEEIQVTEHAQKKTNSIEIDLTKEEQYQVNSVFDLFKKNSSTEVGGGAINVQRVYLRGIESTNLNISLDGAKQGKNMFQHRGNELGINPDLLKAVEVKTAPDASKSGSFGGSIQMTTKDAQDFVTKNKKRGAILKTGYSTNTHTKLGSATAYEVFNNYFGMYASVSGVNSNNYEDGNNNEVYATAYHDRDYLVKFSILDAKNHDLKITLKENENSGNFQWGKLGSDTGIHDPNGANPLEKIVSTTTTYGIQHKYNPSKLVNLETHLNLSNVNINRKDMNEEYENKAVGVTVQNHFDFDILHKANRVSLGAEIQKEEGNANISSLAEVNSKNQALFFQNNLNWNDLNIYYGLRFDDYTFETGLGKTKDKSYSPNIGFDYALTSNSKIYANYAQSSRMSGIIPFTWMTNISPNKTYSSHLKPETSSTYEMGFKYDKSDVLLNEDYMGFDVNVFKTDIKDLIIAKDVSGGSGEGGKALVDMYNSSNEFESNGFEIKVFYHYDNYTTTLSYTQIDANTTNDDTHGMPGVDESITIRRVGTYDTKKLIWNSGVEVSKTLWVDYTLSAVSGIDNPIQRAGYTIHDISMKWQPSIKSQWTYFVAVNNLTDKYYASHSTISAKNNADVYRYEMGRDFRFSVKYEF